MGWLSVERRPKELVDLCDGLAAADADDSNTSESWRRRYRSDGIAMAGFANRIHILKRLIRIELTLEAWKASVLPLNYRRIATRGYADGMFFSSD